MPFVPHTKQDEQFMLESVGVDSIEALFDEIPPELKSGVLDQTPAGISEMALMRLMNDRAASDEVKLSFLGAGAYEHHIPAAVWNIVGRGEYMTAYTPYQAEASQGTLQLIYEFQSMITRLTGMDVANASVYEGASALAEGILMAVRANRKSKSKRILCAGTLNPTYVSACRNIVTNQKITLELLDYDQDAGRTAMESLNAYEGEDIAALVIPCPNFFGGIEQIDALTEWAKSQGALVIAVVNPTALGLLKPPGEWGEDGVDIVVGEGQPLGIPLASGGPYAGFMCCKQSIVRQMPGRIIGQTVDLDGKRGFALTLQAREQHIRRAKSTSNICTNQGLLVTAATIYMSLLGNTGLRSVANKCHENIIALLERATKIEGVSRRFTAPVFHEVVLKLPRAPAEVLESMSKSKILGGFDLSLSDDPALSDCLLVNATETKTLEDIELFATSLEAACGGASC